MSRSLPPKPDLEYLKREAKRLVKRLRTGETGVLPDLDETATLTDVQHAIARDYGFPGWTDLKHYVESQTPYLKRVRPTLRISSLEKAMAHYVEWLGFELLWEWREAPGQPAIAEFSRDGYTFMVNEAPYGTTKAVFHIDVVNLDALVDEWNERRPGSAEVKISPPYEFPDLSITDDDGHVFVFEGKDDVIEAKRRDEVRPKMRAFVQAALDAGEDFPTPEAIRDAVGPPLGTAIEVLNEFEGYAEAFARWQQEADSD